jgi:PPOX class probable F420-dependent enzyme
MAEIAVFKNQSYLNLETMKKSGQAMPTPVWFVERDGALFVRTEAQSGKVKRIRNNPQVRIAPCGSRGELKGEWVGAAAQLVADEATPAQINDMLNKKYGLLKAAFDLMGKLNKRDYATIKITL